MIERDEIHQYWKTAGGITNQPLAGNESWECCQPALAVAFWSSMQVGAFSAVAFPFWPNKTDVI